MAARRSLSIPSLGPTTLFSHSNCLFTPADTSVLLSPLLFFLFSARVAVALVKSRSASAADDANLSCMGGTSAWGCISDYRVQEWVGNHIVGEISNTYRELH